MASLSPALSLLLVALLVTASFCQIHAVDVDAAVDGLWPDYNDGTWPACCTRSEFNEKEITTLLDALEKYWPSLSCGSPSTCHGGKGSFWGHEVVINFTQKHGTCSSPVVRDEYSYFLTTLNVYFKYNVTKVLSEAGYVPSNSEKYPLGGIISAIQNAFHATPKLICSKGAVEELHLCFYKDFQLVLDEIGLSWREDMDYLKAEKITFADPRDCLTGTSMQNDMNSSKSSCPKYVSLPAYVSSGLDASKAAAMDS
ncbi:hypothetical protein JRO89_XS01G0107800 [Xanthoceras sorbifolium]|uniref:Uncharacterized protein n=1 Tax=Xanthoceras sorbifolium TaxID=99658 RepID=A0ABQ8IIR9_9ROSI|nr:hypothetical protein JRO89_XS01G0107800 [Xanthoceras sorbifolium]